MSQQREKPPMGLKAETLKVAKENLEAGRHLMALGQYEQGLKMIHDAQADAAFVTEQSTFDRLIFEHTSRVLAKAQRNGDSYA
jgi:hypothetical protein